MVSTGTVTSVQLIELLTYRVHRLSIGTAQSWATALENGLVRAAVTLWQQYVQTGHRHRDFLIYRMTGTGRLPPKSLPVSGRSLVAGPGRFDPHTENPSRFRHPV